MRAKLTVLMAATMVLAANVSYAEEPAPGKQVAQTMELPANTVVRPRMTEEERNVEKARRDALTQQQREAEDRERRFKSFEEMKNPKPLSETETQTISYLLFLPDDYDADNGKQWPLVLFLHGSGERGEDINKVKVHGPPKLLDDPEKAKNCSFITVSPQCPADQSWSPLQLGRMLDELETMYAVDKDRIYVTGLSMGGFGTWGLLYQFPDRFAAGAPICGGFDPAAAERFVDIPLWVFHGAKDGAVKLEMSTDMVDAIQAKGGVRVQLTVYPDLEHDSWTITYDSPWFYDWMLKQNLSRRIPREKAATIPQPKLEAFYREVAGRPELTVMLTNTGQTPFTVLNPFDAFYVRLEILDAEGNNLLRDEGTGIHSTSLKDKPTLTKLNPGRGVQCKIDLLDGFASVGFGHGTMAETHHHVPAAFTGKRNISEDDVVKIRKIRIVLKSDWDLSGTVFSFPLAVKMLYGFDHEKESLFTGQRQVVEIPLGEKVDRTRLQIGQLLELGEPVLPQPLMDDRVLLPPLPHSEIKRFPNGKN